MSPIAPSRRRASRNTDRVEKGGVLEKLSETSHRLVPPESVSQSEKKNVGDRRIADHSAMRCDHRLPSPRLDKNAASGGRVHAQETAIRLVRTRRRVARCACAHAFRGASRVGGIEWARAQPPIRRATGCAARFWPGIDGWRVTARRLDYRRITEREAGIGKRTWIPPEAGNLVTVLTETVSKQPRHRVSVLALALEPQRCTSLTAQMQRT